MFDHDQRTVQSVVTSAAVGGFVFLAMVGWVLALDVSSIATMIAGSAEKDLLSVLFIGGSLTKGVIIGTAFGLALAARSRRATREVPALIAVPAAA